jgi:dTDP-4-dehydrorhamnose reductase
MRVLIIGNRGQLGSEMSAFCLRKGHDVSGVDVPDIDIRDEARTVECVVRHAPDIVINCAAYTAVDDCESRHDLAFGINEGGAANLAGAARAAGCALVHFSTDYVFDGLKRAPYVETDAAAPLSVYGFSKLAGERKIVHILERHFIFRLSWLYGAAGANFVKTIRAAAIQRKAEGKPLSVVNDQIGTPTCARDVCRQVWEVVPSGAYGLYHCTSEGWCSWYDFACEIVKHAGTDVEVRPCSTSEYPRPARRPAYSVLQNLGIQRLGCGVMPDWRDGFADFLREEKAAG